jgi:hypothetical protein
VDRVFRDSRVLSVEREMQEPQVLRDFRVWLDLRVTDYRVIRETRVQLAHRAQRGLRVQGGRKDFRAYLDRQPTLEPREAKVTRVRRDTRAFKGFRAVDPRGFRVYKDFRVSRVRSMSVRRDTRVLRV